MPTARELAALAKQTPQYVRIHAQNADGQQLQHHYLDADQWDLPAGRIEANETPLEAAVRELYERTGYRGAAADFTSAAETEPGFSRFQVPLEKLQQTAAPQTATRLFKHADLLPGVQLRPHQQEAAESAAANEQERKLFYHALGSGKSLTSLAASESAGEPYTAVAPASLRTNFRKEQRKFTDMSLPSNLVSYNSVAKGGVPSTPTVLFDEAQRMRNPESKTTQNAQDLASEAERVYLLSATPIVNHPHDLAPLMAMLTRKPMDAATFDSKFVGTKRVRPGLGGWLRGVKPVDVPTMKNEDEFARELKGHVSYYAPDKPAVESKEERYETELSPQQNKLYRGFWGQLPALTRWKLQRDFPLTKQELLKLHSFLAGPRQVGLSTLPFMKGKADPYKAFEQSPKLQKAVSLMTDALKQDPEARGVAFSNFIDAGLKPYGAALDKQKIPYGIFHGGMGDGQRKNVVDQYNAGKLRALLLGPSGGEGISLKGTRLLQILDPHWNSARSTQAVGRGIRYDSHTHLPIDDRNVRVQRFINRMPQGRLSRLWQSFTGRKPDVLRQSPGVDTYLENMSAKKDELNNQFLEALKRIGTTT